MYVSKMKWVCHCSYMYILVVQAMARVVTRPSTHLVCAIYSSFQKMGKLNELVMSDGQGIN